MDMADFLQRLLWTENIEKVINLAMFFFFLNCEIDQTLTKMLYIFFLSFRYD